jgi:transposase-like protein
MPNRPSCPKCNKPAMLARVMPATKGMVRETYECPACDHSWNVYVTDPLAEGTPGLASELKPPH